MSNDSTGDEVGLIDNTVAVLAIAEQLPISLHGIEATTKGFKILLFLDAHKLGNFLARQGNALLPHDIENQLPTGDGTFVFFRLAGGKGIFNLALLAFGGAQRVISEWNESRVSAQMGGNRTRRIPQRIKSAMSPFLTIDKRKSNNQNAGLGLR